MIEELIHRRVREEEEEPSLFLFLSFCLARHHHRIMDNTADDCKENFVWRDDERQL